MSQLASCFSFSKGNMNNTTSTSNSQALSSASLSASAVLRSHTLSSNSSSASTSLVFTGITVPDNAPSDKDIFDNSLNRSASESDEALFDADGTSVTENNLQVLAGGLLRYADFCESNDGELDSKKVKLLRGKARNLYSCGSAYIDFKCLKVGCEHTLVLNQHCKSRVCPECSSRKRFDWREKYLPYLDKIDPSQLRFMTLTLRNREDLHLGHEEMVRCFKTLRLKWFKDHFLGGLVGYECHEGADGLWNIHCHILYHGKYIDQAKLSQAWLKITEDSDIVWVSSVLGKDYKCKYRNKRISAQQSALDYILKYVVKGVAVSVGNVGLSSHFSQSWGAEDWDRVDLGTPLSSFERGNEARSAGNSPWSVKSLSEFLVFLHKSRLLQPFGSFIGKSCQHSKNQLACPECQSEFYSLSIKHSGKEIFNALYFIHPDAPHLLSGGRIPKPEDRKGKSGRRKTVDRIAVDDSVSSVERMATACFSVHLRNSVT